MILIYLSFVFYFSNFTTFHTFSKTFPLSKTWTKIVIKCNILTTETVLPSSLNVIRLSHGALGQSAKWLATWTYKPDAIRIPRENKTLKTFLKSASFSMKSNTDWPVRYLRTFTKFFQKFPPLQVNINSKDRICCASTAYVDRGQYLWTYKVYVNVVIDNSCNRKYDDYFYEHLKVTDIVKLIMSLRRVTCK
jgi:hypothetical protein